MNQQKSVPIALWYSILYSGSLAFSDINFTTKSEYMNVPCSEKTLDERTPTLLQPIILLHQKINIQLFKLDS